MKIKSNIELLRLILFLMVVSIHVTTEGLVAKTGGYIIGSMSWYYASLMRLFVAPAVLGFILISGYLMINKNFDFRKYLGKIIAPFLIYFPLLFLFDCSTIYGDIFVKIFLALNHFIYLTGAFYHLWYIVVLIIFAVFIPYINKLFSYCSKKQHGRMILLLLFTSSINSTTLLFADKLLFDGLLGSSSRILLFATLYIVGAYIGKYEIKFKKYIYLLGFMVIPVLTYSYCVLYGKSILNYIELSSLFILLQGIFLFLFFIKLELNSKLVNYIGGLVYGGYIVHVLFISFLQRLFPLAAYYNTKYYFLIDWIFILLVVVLSIIAESIRLYLHKILISIFACLVNKISYTPKKQKSIVNTIF